MEAVMVQFTLLPQLFPEGSEEKHKKSSANIYFHYMAIIKYSQSVKSCNRTYPSRLEF
jgi:hypothetical protein